MRRGPSSITVLFAAVTILVLGLSGIVIWKSHPTAPPPQLTRLSPESSPAARESSPPHLGLGPPAVSPRFQQPPADPGLAMVASPTAVATGLIPDAAAPTDSGSAEIPWNRGRVIAAHNQKIRIEADERVFDARKLSESSREAIRRINADFASTNQAFLGGVDAGIPGGDVRSVATSPDADRLRRAALDAVLGLDESRNFQTAERLAARALLPKYRRQWSRELRDPARDRAADGKPSF